MKRRARNRISLLMIVAILAIGIFALIGAAESLKASFHLWAVSSDIADPVLVWNGLIEHGPVFLPAWRYTPDNWLLSLFPADFVLFLLFGTAPVVLIITGLLIFYLSIGFVGLIIGREHGMMAGWITGAILMFAGQPVLGADGFLSYPVSHGITMLWGLASLFLVTRWLDTGRRGFLIGGGACLYVAAQSDPWALAAFVAPIGITSGLLLFSVWRDRTARWPSQALLMMSVIVVVLVESRLVGLLAFLPRPTQQIGDWQTMRHNLVQAAHYIVVFFNILPGTLNHQGTVPSRMVIIVDVGVFGAVMVLATLRLVQNGRAMSLRRRFIALTALWSILTMILALVITRFAVGMVTARYFSNLFVFVPILLVMTLPEVDSMARWFDLGVIAALGLMFVISGVLSNRDILNARLPHVRLNGIPKLAGFLELHGLSYGFGPYWAAQANAVGWVTHGRVVIRPVVFVAALDRYVPKGVQTRARWYKPVETMQRRGRVFFIVPSDRNACGSAGDCIAIAERQFGKPQTILSYGLLSVLVFERPIALLP